MSDILLYEGVAPDTPPAGTVILYPKVDGRFYFKNDTGQEFALRPDGAGSGDLLSDGSIPLIADWDVGAFKLRAEQFESDVITGTAPFIVASSTMVGNLNVEFLNGLTSIAFATAAQGATADSALQPGSVGSAAYEDVSSFATAAQGATADSAVQPGALGSAAYVETTVFAPAEGFPSVSDETGVAYEFVADDLRRCKTANNVAASIYSIPDALGAGGNTLNLYNKGAGPVTFAMLGTDTLISVDNVCEQYKAVTVLKVSATEWAVIGGTA